MGEKVVVEITSEESVAVVAFKAASITGVEEISAASRQIKEFVQKNRPRVIVFDFQAVKFFSSQVLGLLLEIRAELQAYDGDVVISAINPRLHRVLKITSLDKIFRFFPEKDGAVRTMSAE